MSTYTIAEAALHARILAFPGPPTFDGATCTRGDFRALDARGADVACVLMQAGRSELGDTLDGGRGTHGKRQQRHRIGATLFVKRGTGAGGDGAAYVALTALTDALCAHLDRYPRLGGAPGVKRAQVVELGDVRARDARPHLWQTLLIEVLTETAPDLMEGAS